MKKYIFASLLLGLNVHANDSIYGGYNPASRTQNPAGLENPLGLRKQLCRELLGGRYCFVTAKMNIPLQPAQQQVMGACYADQILVDQNALASFIDPQIANGSNRFYLEGFTIGDYVSECAILERKGYL